MERAELEALREGLHQAERGLYIAPVRHHSPACAWAVRALIRAVRPATVAIEAPADFEAHLPHLLDRETAPPVAIAALVEPPRAVEAAEDGPPADAAPRLAAYYPLCAHSPEFVAMIEARRLGAAIRFIDEPSAQKALRRGPAPEDQPTPLQREPLFDAGAYVTALRARLGCRDGFELWDHLFEARLGEADWRGFLADVGAYCAGIRAGTPEAEIAAEGDLAREARMAAGIAAALQDGPVAAVVGGFHAPALIERLTGPALERPETGTKAVAAQSYLIRFGFAALDALNGYAAGLPQPGYYDRLWRAAEAAKGAPAWRDLAAAIACGFAREVRAAGGALSAPAQIEMLRVAETLARLRGRPGAMRYDLLDGLEAAVVKGDGAEGSVWRERFLGHLRGDALGEVPPSAGSPPLVEDARRRARAHRLDISDGAQRRRKLDIRRKPSHRAASQFLHAMGLLDSGFATREIGPDFLTDMRTDLLFEEWRYAWSPQVEARLIEGAALGDQVPAACLAALRRRRSAMIEEGRGDALDEVVDLFARGLLAGLGLRLRAFLDLLAADVAEKGTFGSVARALRRLHGVATSRGPLSAPPALDVGGVRRAAYARLVYLCDDLPNTKPELIAERLAALRLVVELLRGPGGEAFDSSLFEAALARVATADPPPEILGAVLAIGALASAEGPAALLAALEGRFTGAAVDQADRIGVLRGVLSVDPSLLWRLDGLLEAVDRFLVGLDEEAFLALLPHLRLAFTALSPREADQMAALLARRHGLAAGAFTPMNATLTEADLARGAAIEQRLRAALRADGLEVWIDAPRTPDQASAAETSEARP